MQKTKSPHSNAGKERFDYASNLAYHQAKVKRGLGCPPLTNRGRCE